MEKNLGKLNSRIPAVKPEPGKAINKISESLIPAKKADLDYQLDQLEKSVIALRDRLNPVMQPVAAPLEEIERATYPCLFAEDLARSEDRVKVINFMVNDIYKRIEI